MALMIGKVSRGLITHQCQRHYCLIIRLSIPHNPEGIMNNMSKANLATTWYKLEIPIFGSMRAACKEIIHICISLQGQELFYCVKGSVEAV